MPHKSVPPSNRMKMTEAERNSPEPLWGAEEAGAYLRKKPSTIKKWVRQKRIPFVRIGGENFFRASDLEAWVNLQMVPAEAEADDEETEAA